MVLQPPYMPIQTTNLIMNTFHMICHTKELILLIKHAISLIKCKATISVNSMTLVNLEEEELKLEPLKMTEIFDQLLKLAKERIIGFTCIICDIYYGQELFVCFFVSLQLLRGTF